MTELASERRVWAPAPRYCQWAVCGDRVSTDGLNSPSDAPDSANRPAVYFHSLTRALARLCPSQTARLQLLRLAD